MRQETGASPMTLVASGKNAGRLTVNFSAGDDRSAKDYLLGAGTLLLEDDLVHQLYFVCLRSEPRTISYIAPDARATGAGSLMFVAEEQVELGNRAKLTGRHFTFGTGDNRREIWIDSTGRLLRVAIPGQQIDALRDEPPR
jgi:hypothetical protein